MHLSNELVHVRDPVWLIKSLPLNQCASCPALLKLEPGLPIIRRPVGLVGLARVFDILCVGHFDLQALFPGGRLAFFLILENLFVDWDGLVRCLLSLATT